jgi:hypothetical protein
MPTYEIVGVRFNLDKPEEKLIFDSLKGKKATHIKNILKEIFISNKIEYIKKSYIEEVVNEFLSNKNIQINTEIKSENNEIETISENDLLMAALNLVKGV